MPVESDTIDGTCICRISGDLCIWEAAEIWQRIYPLLTAGIPLTLDLSAVNACDGAGLQILCQIQRAVMDLQKPIKCSGASAAVLAAMRQAGMAADAIAAFDRER